LAEVIGYLATNSKNFDEKLKKAKMELSNKFVDDNKLKNFEEKLLSRKEYEGNKRDTISQLTSFKTRLQELSMMKSESDMEIKRIHELVNMNASMDQL
jgi:hypothetical protein